MLENMLNVQFLHLDVMCIKQNNQVFNKYSSLLWDITWVIWITYESIMMLLDFGTTSHGNKHQLPNHIAQCALVDGQVPFETETELTNKIIVI